MASRPRRFHCRRLLSCSWRAAQSASVALGANAAGGILAQPPPSSIAASKIHLARITGRISAAYQLVPDCRNHCSCRLPRPRSPLPWRPDATIPHPNVQQSRHPAADPLPQLGIQARALGYPAGNAPTLGYREYRGHRAAAEAPFAISARASSKRSVLSANV